MASSSAAKCSPLSSIPPFQICCTMLLCATTCNYSGWCTGFSILTIIYSQKRNLGLPSSISSSSNLHSIPPCIHAPVAGLQREYQLQQNQWFFSVRLCHVPIQGLHRVGLEKRYIDVELPGDRASEFLHSRFFFGGLFWWQGSWLELWRHDVVRVVMLAEWFPLYLFLLLLSLPSLSSSLLVSSLLFSLLSLASLLFKTGSAKANKFH